MLEQEDTQKDKFLTFILSGESNGVDIKTMIGLVLIVVNLKEIAIGLIVNSVVADIIDIPDTEIVPPPDINKGGNKCMGVSDKSAVK